MGIFCRCKKSKVVVLLDVDSFEVQVRGKNAGIDPYRLKTEPWAVCCFLITCSNAPARKYGIERGPHHSQNLDPRLQILPTPYKYGKPENLTTRKAGEDIYDSITNTLQRIGCGWKKICSACNCLLGEPKIEKSNCDEFYLDLTDEVHQRILDHTNLDYSLFSRRKRNFKIILSEATIGKEYLNFSHGLNYIEEKISDDRQILGLLHASQIVSLILDDILRDLHFVVSGGVGHNKLFAKLACHMSKPDGIAVLPSQSWKRIQHQVSYLKIPGLGGTTGKIIQNWWPDLKTIADLRNNFHQLLRKEKWLQRKCDPSTIFLMLSGIDNRPVENKYLLDKITCGKSLNTYARNRATTKEDFIFHLYNRFREMRDNILYENDRHSRTPSFLRLEIYQHYPNANSKRNVFREQISFPSKRMMQQFENWRRRRGPRGRYGSAVLNEWKPLLGQFKTLINENSKVPLFRNDGYYIAELCRINLIAYFE